MMIETQPLPHEQSDNVVALRSARREERKQAVIQFVKDHPAISVAGGIAAGMLISALLPRRPMRKAARRTAAFADIVGTAAMTLGRQAAERAGSAGVDLRERGEALADRAEDVGAIAAKRIGTFGHAAAEQAEKFGDTAARRLGKAGGAAASSLGTAGEAAADLLGKLLASTETEVERTGKRLSRSARTMRKSATKRLG